MIAAGPNQSDEGDAAVSIDFDDVIKRMDAAPALSLVAPVRITAHGEEGTVFYGYGGLAYEPPDPAFVYVDAGDILLTQEESYEFEGGRLTTEGVMTNGRVKLLNNQAYDPSSPDNWVPPTYQSFLITQAELAAIQIGWASRRGDPTHRRIIVRVTRGSWPQFVVADIESLISRSPMSPHPRTSNSGPSPGFTVMR